MKGSEFVFDYIHLLYYRCHEINPNRDGVYINFPDWTKIKTQQQINSINKKCNKCFQYPVTVALNHEKAEKNILEKLQKLNLL